MIERGNVRRREANAIFEVEQSLKVGYRGYLDDIASTDERTMTEHVGRVHSIVVDIDDVLRSAFLTTTHLHTSSRLDPTVMPQVGLWSA